jgi:segregation and condensation protein A
MAATLIEIKSKMLLPQEVIIEDGVEFELDPRDDLVKRLIEYKQFKEAAEVLKISELIESQVYYKPREDLSVYNDPIEELGNLNLAQLVKVINNIISRNTIQEKLLEISEIHREEYTLEDCMDEIEIMLLKSNKFKFSALLNIQTSKEEIITYFLSLLELIKLKSVFVYQDGVFTDLVIEKRMKEE